ncbi:unnamed protein product, partial [Polarella glacialis]
MQFRYLDTSYFGGSLTFPCLQKVQHETEPAMARAMSHRSPVRLKDLIDSEYMFIVYTMAKLVLFIFVINHIIACVWYMVGRMTMEQGEFSWIKDTGRAPVFEQGLAWRYTTALHWSLTQFTPASMDVNARNVPERVMSILVLFFSLITFSSIV